jgi:hypothetical protein
MFEVLSYLNIYGKKNPFCKNKTFSIIFLFSKTRIRNEVYFLEIQSLMFEGIIIPQHLWKERNPFCQTKQFLLLYEGYNMYITYNLSIRD